MGDEVMGGDGDGEAMVMGGHDSVVMGGHYGEVMGGERVGLGRRHPPSSPSRTTVMIPLAHTLPPSLTHSLTHSHTH